MTRYIIFNLILLCLVAAMLIWITTSRLNDFTAYHTAIAQESASSAADEITAFISEKKRLVKIFGIDHKDIIKALIKNPDDDLLNETFQHRIETYFPDYFTFTITDARGAPFKVDFDGLVGDLCLEDLQSFAHTDNQFPRVHPHSKTYHFDVLTKLNIDDKQAILFVSFDSDILGDILKRSQTKGHQLMLIRPQDSNLIEVTDTGSRINLDRDDFRMSADEVERILIDIKIPDSDWHIIDLHASDLFTEFKEKMLVSNLLIFLLYLLTILIMISLMGRKEKLRQKAEGYKDEFLSIVSHELRTPITSIYGSLSLLRGGKAGDISEKGEKITDIALKNCNRLNILINDLLDLQKMEAGKMDFDFKQIEINAFLKQCIENNRGYADKHGVSFNLVYADTNLIVNIDENRIAQVIANLLSNAAKYGASNDNIDISLKAIGGYAHISITDHGQGIPDSFHDRVFEKFARPDAADNHDSGSSGLGLSIVKLIIEEHHGRVCFETETGKGTTFYIDLPLVEN